MAELMTSDEVDELLAERHVAIITTLNRDGSPQSTPVWYMPEADTIWVIADQDSLKVRNLRRDPRVSIMIATDSSPYRYVVFRGEARLRDIEVLELPTRMAKRYLGKAGGARYMADIDPHPPSTIIELTRNRSTTWVDRFPYAFED
ncbi:MAG: PPOX class F420-dependent oxidoreductase [Chloroflexi bacterium]|nr:PPOX class F420-dependent oxidoreductase [Chloroflexota bacterium]